MVVLYDKIKNCETIHQEGRALPLRNLYLDVATKLGIGVGVNMKIIRKLQRRKQVIRFKSKSDLRQEG
jgi:hypothetical protein